jgi:cytoskeletal protein CcmA (bactofilin family)
VRISGKVMGNVVGQDRVEVMATGTVEGDIVAPRVTVADGAFLKGKVEMTSTGGGSES